MRVGQGQFVLEFSLAEDPEPMITEFGFAAEGDFTAPSVSIAHDAYDAFVTRLLSFVCADYSLVAVHMQVQVALGLSENTWAENVAGGAAVAVTPQNTSYLLRKRTGEPGRGANGRSYLPGVPEGHVGPQGIVDGAWRDSFNTELDGLLTDFNGVALPSLVVNYGLRVDPADPPPRVPHVDPVNEIGFIESLVCDARVATQRRRLRR